MDRKKLLDNFRNDEEKIVIAKIYDCYNKALKNQKQVFSDFIDPVKRNKFLNLMRIEGNDELIVKSFGGYEFAERQVLGFCPKMIPFEEENFPISCLNITYLSKYDEPIRHGDFLGTMIALGVDRFHIGDIALSKDKTLVFVDSKVSEYILNNLETVRKIKVNVELDDMNDIFVPFEPKVFRKISVPSLRVDAIISKSLGISRCKSYDLVRNKKVSINWSNTNSPAKSIKPNDIVAVRGYGRIEISNIETSTKGEKYIIYINHRGNK